MYTASNTAQDSPNDSKVAGETVSLRVDGGGTVTARREAQEVFNLSSGQYPTWSLTQAGRLPHDRSPGAVHTLAQAFELRLPTSPKLGHESTNIRVNTDAQ
jgi:hypothetical protein